MSRQHAGWRSRCVAALMLAAGCADEHAATDAYVAPDAYVTPDTGPDHTEALAVYDQLFDALCATAVRCARPDTAGSDYARFACAPDRRTHGEASIEAGYWTVDVAVAQRCIDAVTTMSCVVSNADFLDLPWDHWSIDYAVAACQLAVRGPLTCGMPPVVCGPAESCAFGFGSECGRCIPAVPAGGACDAAHWCADGLGCYSGTCATDPPQPTCTAQRCRAAGLGHDCLGDACADSPNLGEACPNPAGGSPALCRTDLVCRDGVCRLQPRVGDPCGPGVPCGRSQICDPVSSTCQPSSRCSSWGDCPASWYCSLATDQCVTDPQGAPCDVRQSAGLGAPLAVLLDTCPEGYACSGEAGRCARTVALGEPCGAAGTACVEGAQCSGGICVPFENPWLAAPDAGVCY